MRSRGQGVAWSSDKDWAILEATSTIRIPDPRLKSTFSEVRIFEEGGGAEVAILPRSSYLLDQKVLVHSSFLFKLHEP